MHPSQNPNQPQNLGQNLGSSRDQYNLSTQYQQPQQQSQQQPPPQQQQQYPPQQYAPPPQHHGVAPGSLTTSQLAPGNNTSGGDDTRVTYSAERVIGSGSFGVVYQARVLSGQIPSTQQHDYVAIKKVYLDPEFKNRELQIMKELHHPCVVQLLHCFYTNSEGTRADGRADSRTYLNLVMNYVPSSIYRIIRDHSAARYCLHIECVRRYFYQILRGLAYIHDRGICHRDLKPQNVLLNPDTSEVRICDFGSAKRLQPTEQNVAYICSRYYRAPELALGARQYSTAVDMWSAGCVLAELLTGKPLFQGSQSTDQIKRIQAVLGSPTAKDLSAMGVTQTQGLLDSETNPCGMVHALGSTSYDFHVVDLLKQLLTYNPHTRLPAFEALAHPFFASLHMPDQVIITDIPRFAFEIRQHQNWTMRECELMNQKGLSSQLMPVWCKDFVDKAHQLAAGQDLQALYQQLVPLQQQQQHQQILLQQQQQFQQQQFQQQQALAQQQQQQQRDYNPNNAGQ